MEGRGERVGGEGKGGEEEEEKGIRFGEVRASGEPPIVK